MKLKRCSGILLHPTSLPGRNGIGTLGREAFKFIDFLEKSGQKIWQILPLGPVGFANSPYQCYSSIAGNPLLICPDELVSHGLLTEQDVTGHDYFNPDREKVNFDDVKVRSNLLLRKAYDNFTVTATENEQHEFETFCSLNKQWLDEYAFFMALKIYFDDKAWYEWADDFKLRKIDAMEFYRKKLSGEICFQQFCQFLFFEQWGAVRDYAGARGISIIGDIPLYVSYDSADVWLHPEFFQLDKNRDPVAVAGVPPDYFSETGQLWGNPVYNWKALEKDKFKWWINRVQNNLKLYDIIRIDHFRGLAAYWAIPFGDDTAVNGKWVAAPGKKLFDMMLCKLGDLPIIAEDLGVMTAEVEELRDTFEFPGMKILQFAFDSGEQNDYLPHTYTKNCVVYTGTHDNNTVAGWWGSASDEDRQRVLEYLDCDGHDVCQAMIKAAWASVADIAIVPVQDILGLGGEARMNTPGVPAENWQWRLKEGLLTDTIAEKLKKISKIYGR